MNQLNVLPANAFPMRRGQAKTLGLTVVDGNGKPYNLTGATVILTVKESAESQNVLIRKTSENAAQAIITAPREGLAQIYMSPSDTRNLAVKQYVFDVWVVTADGKPYPVVEESVLDLKPSITVLS